VPGWTAAAGKRVLLPTGLFAAQEKHLFEHANRVWPVYFRYPYSTADDLTFELPEGWKIASMPKEIDRDAKAVEYKMKVEDNGGAVRVRRTLRCDVVFVAKENYSVLRTFYQTVKAEDEQQIVLQPGGSSPAN